MDVGDIRREFGAGVEDFFEKLETEIQPYIDLVEGLFEEYRIFESLYRSERFNVDDSSALLDVINYILLLKQYELAKASVTALLKNDYMVCTTLVRSMFETNMFMVFLSKHPDKAEDFVAFSEINGNPDIDWSAHGISNNRKQKLKSTFAIGRMITGLYEHTKDEQKRINTDHFYQQLCNATHPNLETSSISYEAGNPPTSAFSNLGIRRTVTQLYSVINASIECLSGSILKDKKILLESYKRRKNIYKLHDFATQWHRENPQANPAHAHNEQFRIGWKDGRPVITLMAKNA